jgi:molybdate transport system substrate-binding protein
VRRFRRYLPVILPALLGLFAVACGDDSATSSTGTTAGATTGTLEGEITVFAAASLTGSFTEIAEAFQAENPGTKVTFSFAASSALVQQINEGAPADVYASADQANMKKLTDAGNASGEPEIFATNALAIITGAGNPEGITGVEDLANPDLIVVTCGADVPIGKYSAEVFANAGVTVTPKSYEADVKAVVNKVTLGEADAGVVYATDVKAAGAKASGVEIPDDINVIASYPIAVTKAAKNARVSEAFVTFVLSAAGQDLLAGAGFTDA